MSYAKIEIERLQTICNKRIQDLRKFKGGNLSESSRLKIEEACNHLLCLCELADQRIVELSQEDAYFISYNLSKFDW